MCPLTDATSAENEFAADVLKSVLDRIELANQESDRGTYLVSHAWTEGPLLYVVYAAPPSNRTWGLVRDTTQSIINPGPWDPRDDPAHYYYLVDFEENQPSSSMRPPDEPDTTWWFGHPLDGLPQHLDEIPEEKPHSGTPRVPPRDDRSSPPPGMQPRRYGNRT